MIVNLLYLFEPKNKYSFQITLNENHHIEIQFKVYVKGF